MNDAKKFTKIVVENRHPFKKWELSICEFETSTGARWKVTRRIPGMSVAETKIFLSKEEAILQYAEWLR